MATNRELEMVISATYPNSMKHLQQLIMDAEDCAKNIGKKTLLGKDKFEPCFDKFKATMTLCFKALAADNQIDDPENIGAAMTALNLALSRCEKIYSSWPLAFKFWHTTYTKFSLTWDTVDTNLRHKTASQSQPAEAVSKNEAATHHAALQQTKALADQGNPEAQRQLGAIYFAGEVVPQDYKEAVKWYRLAADQGHSAAQYSLGKMYTQGKVVPQDYTEAVKWYRLAANQGNSMAQYELGEMYTQGKVVPQDYAEAVKWYRLAADRGRLSAQYELGKMYSQGKAIPQDYKEAMKWFQLAADQGDSDAQYELGTMYHEGQGVSQNYTQAMMWYLIAEVDCGTSADLKLQQLKPLSTQAQIAEAQRLAREWWAAHHQKN